MGAGVDTAWAVQRDAVDGDPAAKGLVTVRFMMPAGYQIAPHWHPTDEHITVLSGTFSIGMGDKLDMDHGKTLKRAAMRWRRPTCITTRGPRRARPSRCT